VKRRSHETGPTAAQRARLEALIAAVPADATAEAPEFARLTSFLADGMGMLPGLVALVRFRARHDLPGAMVMLLGILDGPDGPQNGAMSA
jgi:hypothetical protein